MKLKDYLNKEEWKQTRVEHCPSSNCNGMLLQSDFEHEEKCSVCNKLFICIEQYIEVEG